MSPEDDPTRAALGIGIGIIIGTAMWITAVVVAILLFGWS